MAQRVPQLAGSSQTGVLGRGPRRWGRGEVGRRPRSRTSGLASQSHRSFAAGVTAPAAVRFLYVTVPHREEALTLARQLVRERLVACGNVLGALTSVYEWQGELEENEEVVLLLKTRAELVGEVTRRVAELHSYECPCIAELPIGAVHEPFAAWIGEQTKAPG